jgi:Arrestin (or S-antigen), N-terminal domain
MGNVDGRSAFDHGTLIVQTDLPYYQPGEQVTGKVYLRITKAIDATHLELEVKGKEKGSFTDFIWEQHKRADGTIEQKRVPVKRSSNRVIMSFKQPCFQFAVGSQGLQPGDYTVPF